MHAPVRLIAGLALALPMLLPGIRINTGTNDFLPVEQMPLGRFDGQHWVLFGELYDAIGGAR